MNYRYLVLGSDMQGEQIALDPEAKEKGITVVPDCGMGPGMNITLSLSAMTLLDETR